MKNLSGYKLLKVSGIILVLVWLMVIEKRLILNSIYHKNVTAVLNSIDKSAFVKPVAKKCVPVIKKPMYCVDTAIVKEIVCDTVKTPVMCKTSRYIKLCRICGKYHIPPHKK